MICRDCIHYEVCNSLNVFRVKTIYSKWKNCKKRALKNQYIQLPMRATDRLKEELTKYCYERCVDEL